MLTKYNNVKTLFQQELGLCLTMRMLSSRGLSNRMRTPKINLPMYANQPENKYLKQNNGTWAEAVEQLDGTIIEIFTPLRIENAQSASSSSLITAPEGGVLNERRCKTKPPEAIFEMDDWTRCWKQTNKDAKSTYDQLTIDLLSKSELNDIKGYPVSFTKDENVSLIKLLPDCVTHEPILTQYMLCNFEDNHIQKYNDKKIQKFDSEHRVINEIQIFAGKHAYSHSEIRISFRPISILVLLHFDTKKISLVVKNSYDFHTEKFTMFAN